jgi:hypothetical protein
MEAVVGELSEESDIFSVAESRIAGRLSCSDIALWQYE